MSVQHNAITDPNIHEPKGVATATAGQLYVANGSGSGTWKKIQSSELQGLSGDSGTSRLAVESDGSGGFVLKRGPAYGVMGITNNTTGFTVGAAVDPTLIATSDYVLYTGTGAPWGGEAMDGMSFTTDRLNVQHAGVYNVRFWGNISSFPTTASKVGVRFKVSGTTWSVRTVVVKSNSSGDYGLLAAFSMVPLIVGDYLQLFVASSAAGSLVMSNANLTAELVKAT